MPADFADQNVCLVWPDCWRAVMFFERIGMGCWQYLERSPVGLRYEALGEIKRAMRVSAKEWADGLFSDVQTMEVEAVKVMRQK